MAISHQMILEYISRHPGAGRSEIKRGVAPDAGDATVWRALARLVEAGKLEVSGKGRATGYTVAGPAVVRAWLQTPYNRRPARSYNKEFLDGYVPNTTFYLTESERSALREAGEPIGAPLPAGTQARRMLERLLIDLSWASSRMEGNTYDILQTEELLHLGREAAGKDRKEAVMILNHKEAIEYLVDNLEEIDVSERDLRNIHALLSDGLLIDPAMSGRLRRTPVAIAHSSYLPLDDPYEIEEEFRIVVEKARAINNPYEQSIFLLIHVPYLQAFDDLNKRTSRVASNIPLLKAGLAPMSFVTMDDRAYVDGLIGIYELNNASLLREAFVDAYRSSAENYRVVRAEVDTPNRAAVLYRELVRNAVRRCVLERKSFDLALVNEMTAEANVPASDQEELFAYIRRQFDALHEGNAIRYRLRPEDLIDIER